MEICLAALALQEHGSEGFRQRQGGEAVAEMVGSVASENGRYVQPAKSFRVGAGRKVRCVCSCVVEAGAARAGAGRRCAVRCRPHM